MNNHIFTIRDIEDLVKPIAEKYKVKENAVNLHGYITNNNIKREDLLTSIPLQWLVTTPLYNIGEHVYYLSDEYKKAHSEIPWSMISGLRHRLVHDYDGTNWNISVCDRTCW